jgi:hypothetical protein
MKVHLVDLKRFFSGEDVYGTLKFEAVFTVYNECKQKLKDVCIHQQRQLWCPEAEEFDANRYE